jgi:hypothetical protein
MKNKILIALCVLTLAVSGYIYKFIYNPNIYLKCKWDLNSVEYIYQFNRNEFKWLLHRTKPGFKYSKKVKYFSKEKAEYMGDYDSDFPGNKQDVSINRMTGTMTWSWIASDTKEKKTQTYYCEEINSLPKPPKPKF